jgi:hypothetical protein
MRGLAPHTLALMNIRYASVAAAEAARREAEAASAAAAAADAAASAAQQTGSTAQATADAAASGDQGARADEAYGWGDHAAAGYQAGLQVMVVEDRKAIDTPGGALSTAPGWNARVLNTVVTNQISGASLASNQVTLPAGQYFVRAAAPGYAVDRHAIRLVDVGTGLTLRFGRAAFATGGVQTDATLAGHLVFLLPTVIKIDHFVTSAAGGTQAGGVELDPSGLPDPLAGFTNRYACMEIWRLGNG